MGLSTNIITLYRPMKFKLIKDCNMCMECKCTGKCVLDDDLSKVLEDIRNADCVVFSAPMYFRAPNALYKVLEDRMYSFLDSAGASTLPSGKKAVIIVTYSDPRSNPDISVKLMKETLEEIGFEVLDTIEYCDNFGKDPANENEDLLREVKALGRTLRNT